ncbi:MAG: hypothetical protein IPM29_09380 [Planctomycetes bacterium]|nr:hypothetical protein [Planctomycetota bacterium]
MLVTRLLVVLSLALATSAVGQSYTWVRNATNDREYALTAPMSWTAAEAEAVQVGGHLATVRSASEQTWLETTFGTSENLWIGLNDAATEGVFEWASGETGAFRNWCPGEPNSGAGGGEDEDFVHISAFPGWCVGPWNDAGRGRVYRGIMERAASWSPLIMDSVTAVLGASDHGAWVVKDGRIQVFDGWRIVRDSGTTPEQWTTRYISDAGTELFLQSNSESCRLADDGRMVLAQNPFLGVHSLDGEAPMLQRGGVTWPGPYGPGSDVLGAYDLASLRPDGTWNRWRREFRASWLQNVFMSVQQEISGPGFHMVIMNYVSAKAYCVDLVSGADLLGCADGNCPFGFRALSSGGYMYWYINHRMGCAGYEGFLNGGQHIETLCWPCMWRYQCGMTQNSAHQEVILDGDSYEFVLRSESGVGVNWESEQAEPFLAKRQVLIFGTQGQGIYANGIWNAVPFVPADYVGSVGSYEVWAYSDAGSYSIAVTEGGATYAVVAQGLRDRPSKVVPFGGGFLFVGNDGAHGSEVQYCDLSAGTCSVALDIVPGTQSSYPRDLSSMGGVAVFVADDGRGPALYCLRPPAYVSYRLSCDGSRGAPHLSADDVPRLGRLFTLRVNGLSPNTAGFLFFALDDARWFGYSLPFELGIVGAAGCWVNVDIDPESGSTEFALLSDSSGRVTLSIPVPNVSELLGFRFYNQYVSLDAPPSRSLGITTTNAGRGVVGL